MADQESQLNQHSVYRTFYGHMTKSNALNHVFIPPWCSLQKYLCHLYSTEQKLDKKFCPSCQIRLVPILHYFKQHVSLYKNTPILQHFLSSRYFWYGISSETFWMERFTLRCMTSVIKLIAHVKRGSTGTVADNILEGILFHFKNLAFGPKVLVDILV